MRKKILLFCSLAFSTIIFAQTSPSFGVRAGLSSAKMSGDAADNLNDLLDFTNGGVTTNSHTGFFGGGYVNIPLTSQLSVEPALYYTQKGYELRGELNVKGLDFLGANAKAKLTSNYIDLPILLKGNFSGFQVFAGPQISYLTKADLRTTAGLLGFNLLNKTMDGTEQFNRWDAGITGGVGYQFANGLNITAAYDHGLSKADKNQNMEAYNRSFKVGLGISF
jgi:Outer membrane protein beta-barrel domain